MLNKPVGFWWNKDGIRWGINPICFKHKPPFYGPNYVEFPYVHHGFKGVLNII